jgi:hypothetical protein
VLSLGCSRGTLIGWLIHTQILNFEVEEERSRTELNYQRDHNQHDSPLEPSVCGLDLGDCPYVALEELS